MTADHAPGPNLFILGAPKCGTTRAGGLPRPAPADLLQSAQGAALFQRGFRQSAHEAAGRLPRLLRRRHAAAANSRGGLGPLFVLAGCRSEHLRFCPDAKFIVMVRNPLEMAPSWYSEAVYSSAFGETAPSFEEAWWLQGERRAGRSIPTICSEPKVLLYRELCSVGGQLQRLLSLVRRESVQIVVFDDFIGDTKAEYRKALRAPRHRRRRPTVLSGHERREAIHASRGSITGLSARGTR